eukprot:scaffold34490_cov62-Phaeocystis_antarctica.AAC.3
MGGGVEGGGGEGGGGKGEGGGGGGGSGEGGGGEGAQRRLEVAVHGETSYSLYPHPEHHAHVADVMVPPELQTCVPVPARAHMHRWLVCDGAWSRESLWCGCGGTELGRGLV